jgi:hypothetical protein
MHDLGGVLLSAAVLSCALVVAAVVMQGNDKMEIER